jgi:hypothetical protein
MKAFFVKLWDFVTDRNGDGDLLKLFGLVIMIAGLVGYFAGKDPLTAWGFGSGLLSAGKALDAITPKAGA